MTFRPVRSYIGRYVLAERQFIERVGRLAGKGNAALVRGIGDDCAILHVEPDRQLLVTTDLCIENVHFRRDWHPAQSVGHRCLARGLSDIAAMGGDPVACFLSLGIPAKLPQKWVDQFLRGLIRLARQFGVPLAGGDTSSAAAITADIVVLGSAPSGKALQRSGARAHDSIYVTGNLGDPAATLQRLYRGEKVRPTRNSRHFYPLPRIEIGRRLREQNPANSMIDISDGLSVDLAHLCRESSVSALIESTSIPVARNATLDLALHGGEDYELLFTAGPDVKVPPTIADVPITKIGKILPRSGRSQVQIRDESGRAKILAPMGWQHFSKM
jgi:thiamine-monophosphate kinase